MMILIASTLFTLVVLPLLALWWLATPGACISRWLLKAAAIGSFAMALFYIGNWQMLSYYGRYVLLLLFMGMFLIGAWRMRGHPFWARPRGWEWGSVLGAAFLLMVSGGFLAGVHAARNIPAEAVDLTFPLHGGTFYVASGGSHPLLNPHMKVDAPQWTDWRGQRWALDIVALTRPATVLVGCILLTLLATRFSACRCMLPATDTTHKAGNYVLLRCDSETYVVLAHLKEGSVLVEPGDMITTGLQLGEVGNSGNTAEPHLHIHVQRTPGRSTALDAEPRPMTFDEAFPVRNHVIRSSVRSADQQHPVGLTTGHP